MLMKKKVLSGAAMTAALIALLGLTWSSASGNSNTVVPDTTRAIGIGETLLLVVADVVPADEASPRVEALNQRFGDLQGFYTDWTDAYEVTGALLQTSPDLKTESCLPVVDPDCSIGDLTKVLQPITTTLVGVSELTRSDVRPLCALSGDSCGLAQARRLLGEDARLEPGTAILATAFRTKRGAQEFLELARAAGVNDLVTLQVKKLAGGDVGLGQEPAPDGSGPLTEPLAGQDTYQR